jgi:glucosyl-3-phosphoglycerate synthase
VDETRTGAALRQPRTVLVPLLNLGVATELVHLAAALVAGVQETPPPEARVVVLGVVEVPPDGHLSEGRSMARAYRALLSFLPSEVPVGHAPDGSPRSVPVHHTVRVAHGVAAGIREAARSGEADLLLLHWKGYATDPAHYSYGETIDDLLNDPPAHIVLARPGGWDVGRRIFVPVRGGPAAELALDISLVLATRLGSSLTVMHSVPRACPLDLDPATSDTARAERLRGEEPYLALAARLNRLEAEGQVPLEHVLTVADDVGQAVAEESRPTDLVVLGAPGVGAGEDPALHPVVGRVLEAQGRPVLLVRARDALDLTAYETPHRRHRSRSAAIAEQWFVENTYHADEFRKLDRWSELKQAHHARISVVLPTFNDATRLTRFLQSLRHVLTGPTAWADEVVVVDGGSTDDTRARVEDVGFAVLTVPESAEPGGNGLVPSLHTALAHLTGDLVVWLDPKAGRLATRLIPVLTAPLLTDPEVRLVKPFWTPSAGEDRPPGSPLGARFSRVTVADLLGMPGSDLAALPMHAWFRVFFPALGALVEPVSRLFAARRPLLESVFAAPPAGGPPLNGVLFYATLLLDTMARHGVRAIAQVELERRPLRHKAPLAGADLRPLRQVSELLDLFAQRPDTHAYHPAFKELQRHLAQMGEL